MPFTVHHSGVLKRCHTSRFFTDKSLQNQGLGDRWQPYQPHPGTQCHRCGCSLPGLTGFTADRCGGTDRVTITTLTCRRAAPLYLSEAKLQPLVGIKNMRGLKHLPMYLERLARPAFLVPDGHCQRQYRLCRTQAAYNPLWRGSGNKRPHHRSWHQTEMP